LKHGAVGDRQVPGELPEPGGAMTTLFDRFNQEIEALGRRAQEVFDESRTRLELVRIRSQRDGAARELGMLYYRRERQLEAVEQGRIDAALFKLDDLTHEIQRLEQQLADAKDVGDSGPAPAAEPSAPAGDAPPDPEATEPPSA